MAASVQSKTVLLATIATCGVGVGAALTRVTSLVSGERLSAAVTDVEWAAIAAGCWRELLRR